MADTGIDVSALDPERTIVVATGNAHKLVEIEAILSSVMPRVTFVALGELGDFPEPEETGTNFRDNALIKALAALDETPFFAAIADDSGLCVDALNGAPGIYSARYAGEHGNDVKNNAKLLEELKDVPEEDRTARFHSTVALVYRDGNVLVGEGNCEGSIDFTPHGENGFGYDPLFLPQDTPGKTMAELTPEQKNAISHRFHALQALASQIKG
ncbi:non-canonical purine NTP pyrophosphatase, RdgB HAM1 family [Lancefieldella rimae]|uniref:dITP/XTP pyrophosphatase n=2 Tax=Lancefieldella rimae TaxID=1383 RepID=B9CMP8_LANR4|nr:RdgB/HAM1 family non-canonical purine NTP pyrophosphatase [Lancefieldella rimae]EEE17416.1 non-canonical purine NTP pyrophosphatase, RdgB/HAM1 family [Lancefieldella rimae ATCC 49626]KRO02530.1 non-canonical purine NTP pyrophosphatase, RdgB HAM1 family [Lancefieldella rimae]